jgi:hypothetical protein
VEVDRAAPLELGHLGIGDSDQPPQLALLDTDREYDAKDIVTTGSR